MAHGPNSIARKPWVRPPAPHKGWTYWITEEAKHFCEKTLAKKGIKLCECDVLVHELELIGLRTQFGVLVLAMCLHPIMVKEFLSNIVSRDYDAHTFTSCPRGKDIVFSVYTIREMQDLLPSMMYLLPLRLCVRLLVVCTRSCNRLKQDT